MAEQLSLISVRTVIKGKALSLNGYAGFFFLSLKLIKVTSFKQIKFKFVKYLLHPLKLRLE